MESEVTLSSFHSIIVNVQDVHDCTVHVLQFTAFDLYPATTETQNQMADAAWSHPWASRRQPMGRSLLPAMEEIQRVAQIVW